MNICLFFNVLILHKWLMEMVRVGTVPATFFVTLRLPYNDRSRVKQATAICENPEVSPEGNNTANPHEINTRFSKLAGLISSGRGISLLSCWLILRGLAYEKVPGSLLPWKCCCPAEWGMYHAQHTG